MQSHKVFKTEWVDDGSCGDAYCTGHSRSFLVCECGAKFDRWEIRDSEHGDAIIKLKHQVAMLMEEVNRPVPTCPCQVVYG